MSGGSPSDPARPAPSPSPAESQTADKAALRALFLERRRQRPAEEQQAAAVALAERVLALPDVAAASTVAAYRSLAGEPGTQPLLDRLLNRGISVLVPVLRPDASLHWRRHPASCGAGLHSNSEPVISATDDVPLATVDAVICPGVAGDAFGNRLGRGGGSYDRALSGLSPTVLPCLLLYDAEVLDVVPVEPHDQPVQLIVTPTRTIRCSARQSKRPPAPDS